MGVTAFFGSLSGGCLSDYAIGLFGLTLALEIVYMISMVGRGIGVATYCRLGRR